MKFKEWEGQDLKGMWVFSIKKDGFQCKNEGGKPVSKNGNPLYHFPDKMKKFHIAEVFCGSWNETSKHCYSF